MFLVNSRLALFTVPHTHLTTEASLLLLLWLGGCGDPFSRSYGVILPSSLARVLSFALVSSTHLPVSVCGTVTCMPPYGAFLVSVELSKLSFATSPSRLSLNVKGFPSFTA